MYLYPKNQGPLTDELFREPTSEYRGAPFWAWNCRMTPENISEMAEMFREMGMGGAHIHSRTGLCNEYMGEEFLSLVKQAHKEFSNCQMITWLYDEDRWPSGFGGGLVTKEEKYRSRFLVFSPKPLDGVSEKELPGIPGPSSRSDNRRLLARYQVCLEDGWLKSYKMLAEGEACGGLVYGEDKRCAGTEACEVREGYRVCDDCTCQEWFAYLEISGTSPRFNNQSYVNTLDKASIEKFIEVTHEKYKDLLGKEFGATVPAIFTDEPQFSHKTRLFYSEDKKEVTVPYTDDLEETFRAAYGHSLLESLPELFWEKREEPVSKIRYEYHDHICERFASAYADTLGEWCENNGIMLTGHMMEEPTLKSQTAALGEAMRSYRSFHLPGIDMLCDWRELSTAKQAASAAHQYGRPGVLSELYGVTNWDFDFRRHKLQGDWQAALGVTVRVPHLSWTSMAGEAKRDYPASIGHQSPWYKEYKYVEDYFARINTLLTRGKADVKIGVIHPIESYWLYWGSEEKTGGIREEMEKNFDSLIKWLLYGLQDFDFICESLLPELNDRSAAGQGGFSVGEMQYQAVIVPNCVTLRRSTFERLKAWKASGGKVIFAGEIPSYIDALPSEEVKALAAECTCVPFAKNVLLKVLEEERMVEIRYRSGLRTRNLIYQMRKEEDDRILFLAHVEKPANPDIPKKKELTITVDGIWNVTCYEPLDGTKEALPASWKQGKTVIHREMHDHDSLLLYLTPAMECVQESDGAPASAIAAKGVPESTAAEAVLENGPAEESVQGNDMPVPTTAVQKAPALKKNMEYEPSVPVTWQTLPTDNVVPVTLSEPNVLVLDMAEYAFDDGEFMPREELLRIDNKFRAVLGYPPRENKIAQPWLEQMKEVPEHVLFLRFTVNSQVDVENTCLALENRNASLAWNGNPVPMEATGWYTDKDIICYPLGAVHKGQNELIVKVPFSRKENVENLFLLGDFGVKVFGSEAVITEPVRKLAFGDYTVQGLPFYGGNVEYHLPVSVPADGRLKVTATRFRNPLLKAAIDEGEEKVIAFSPYAAEMECTAGDHILKLKAFGNRKNTFGALHNCNEREKWFGPTAWRTTGAAWAYEYQIQPCGILKAPVLHCSASSLKYLHG